MNTNPQLSASELIAIKTILLGESEPEDNIQLYSKLIQIYDKPKLLDSLYHEFIHLIMN